MFSKYSAYPISFYIDDDFRLLAIGLELPEETLVNLHGYSSVGETYGEYKITP